MAAATVDGEDIINTLPEIVLVHIFSFLSIDERAVLIEVCKLWYQIIQESPRLAYSCTIRLFSHLPSASDDQVNKRRVGRVIPQALIAAQRRLVNTSSTVAVVPSTDANLIYYAFIYNYVKRFEYDVRHLHISIEQQDKTCQYVLCRLLTLFNHENRQIQTFTLHFIGKNPLMMKCIDIIDSLRSFFHHHSQSIIVCDLSGVMFSLDDDTCTILAKYNPHLRSLNLQDQSLVCCITPYALMQTIDSLKHLTELWVDRVSVTDEALQLLLQTDRDELKHLGIRIRREEKYSDDTNPQLWRQLRERYPNLRMTLDFGLTTPLHRIAEYLKPETRLPVQTLILNTPIRVFNELILAAQSYHETLENVFIRTTGQWVIARSEPVNRAILYLAEHCHNLKTLYCDCGLDETIIRYIHELHPHLMEPGASKLLEYDTPTHNIPQEEMADLFG